jgi:predicted RNase H-like HicB family nuclease
LLGPSSDIAATTSKKNAKLRRWYWAIIDRESDGRFIANVPDLEDVSAWGKTEKDAVAHVADLAGQAVRPLVERGDTAPRARRAGEMPSAIRSREIDRCLIPVEVGRAAANPGPPSNASN